MAYTAWTIASFWQFTVDDAYISGRFARNLAHDLTLSWNPGLPATEGYTNFLYVLLMAAADRLTIDPVLAGKAIGVACTFAILVYLIVLGQRVFGSRWAGLVGAAVFAAYGATPVHAVSGLETMFYTLLLLALADVGRRLWCCDPERSGRHAACLGLLGLAAAWTRPEGVGVFLAVAAIVLGSRRALFNRKTLRALLLTFFLPGLVYMGWRLWYFGYLFPNTFYHKVSSSGMDAALQYFRAFALSLGPLVLLVVALGFRWQRAFLAPVVVVLAALPIYLWTNVSNMGYAYRFVYPALVLVALLVTAASGNLLRALRSVSGRGGLAEPLRAAVLILLLTPQLSRDGDAHQRYYISRYSPGLRSAHVAVGKLLQSVSPTGRLVVWSDAGAIPYFSGWIALDAGGLVDRQIAHHGLSNEYLFAFMPDAIVMTENTPYLANDKGQWKCDQLSAHPPGASMRDLAPSRFRMIMRRGFMRAPVPSTARCGGRSRSRRIMSRSSPSLRVARCRSRFRFWPTDPRKSSFVSRTRTRPRVMWRAWGAYIRPCPANRTGSNSRCMTDTPTIGSPASSTSV